MQFKKNEKTSKLNNTRNNTKVYGREEDKTKCLNICTFNCRTLSNEGKVHELDKALESINWDLIGLSETRIYGEKILEKKMVTYFAI